MLFRVVKLITAFCLVAMSTSIALPHHTVEAAAISGSFEAQRRTLSWMKLVEARDPRKGGGGGGGGSRGGGGGGRNSKKGGKKSRSKYDKLKKCCP